MARVLWIGGSPCCGKSTIARQIANALRLSVYVCDDGFEEHRHLVAPEGQPVFARLMAEDCDGIWMRPVAQQIADEQEIYREEFPFILDDLKRLLSEGLPGDAPAVIAEGAALMPSLLAKHRVPVTRAIWIVPTPAFQRTHYERRAWRHDVLRACSDPAEAWDRWMARDAGFAECAVADAEACGYRSIIVDGSKTIEEIAAIVFDHFGLWQEPSRGLTTVKFD